MATNTETRQTSSRRYLVVAASVLALGLAAGVGAWRAGLHDHRGSVTSPASLQVQPSDGQAGSLPGTGSTAAEQPAYAAETGGSSAAATGSVPSTASPPYLYLVGSTAQAQQVQQSLDWAAIAWQPLDARVLVVPPEVSGGEVAETMNALRGMEGRAPVTVEDLRSPAAPDGTAPSTSDQEAPTDSALLIPADQGHAGSLGAAAMPGQVPAVSGLPDYADVPLGTSVTIYLVGSQAEADAINAGPPALARSVLVVPDAEGDAQAQATIAHQNSLRALVGLAPMTVVDLRMTDTSAEAQ
jgi:hypothetical protein